MPPGGSGMGSGLARPSHHRRAHIGDLRPGDTLDGSHVLSAEREPYDGGYTYDLLPGGDTGFYFADGGSAGQYVDALS